MRTVTYTLNGYQTRIETRNGRKYMVAPVTMLVPGVLNGSKGALYYPPEEVARNVAAWNDVKITVDHPTREDGRHISASAPGVEDIGHVAGATFNGKLTAEAWFDVKRTKATAPDIYKALQTGKKLEVSTGLFTKDEPAPDGAAHNGVAYTHIARSYIPDHLAILVGRTGACSVRQGCGVFNARTDMQIDDIGTDADLDSLVANTQKWEDAKYSANLGIEPALQALTTNSDDDCTCKGKKPKKGKEATTRGGDPVGATVNVDDDDDADRTDDTSDTDDDDEDGVYLGQVPTTTNRHRDDEDSSEGVEETEEWPSLATLNNSSGEQSGPACRMDPDTGERECDDDTTKRNLKALGMKGSKTPQGKKRNAATRKVDAYGWPCM